MAILKNTVIDNLITSTYTGNSSSSGKVGELIIQAPVVTSGSIYVGVYSNITLKTQSGMSFSSLKNVDYTFGGFVGGIPGIYPSLDNTCLFGNASQRWQQIFCTQGTIQTSSKKLKSHIHYIDDNQIHTQSKIKSLEQPEEEMFSTEDLLNFIKELKPVTFVYKNSDGEDVSVNTALNSNNSGSIQLGLISEDIKDNSFYKYVGTNDTYINENNEEITSLGLKPLPLAVLGLVADKYLLNKVEELTSKIEELESKLTN